MKKLLKWVLVTIAILLVGITILIYNPGIFKGLLETQISKATGYSVALNGELEIGIGSHLLLAASDVHISNPEAPVEGGLLSIGDLRLLLNRASLFEPTIIIESLQVDGLELNAQTDKEGVGNWVTSVGRKKAQSAKSDNDSSEPRVLFNTIRLRSVMLHHLKLETGKEQLLDITSFDVSRADGGMLVAALKGSLNTRPVEYSGSVGPYENLLAGYDIKVTGKGHFGSLTISGKGLIDRLRRPAQPEFNIDLQGPDIDEITAMLDIDDLGTGPFAVTASGKLIDGLYHAGIHGTIGDVSLNISASATDLLQPDELDLKLAANGPNLGSLTRAVGIKHWPDKPFTLKGDVKRIGSKLDVTALTLNIGGTQLILDASLTEFHYMDASRIDVSIVGDDVAQFRELLGISGIATGPFSVHGKLAVSDDGVELIQVEAKTSLGQVTVSGTLGAPPGYLGTKLHVHLDGSDARNLLKAIHIEALPPEAFNLDAHAEWQKEGLLLEKGVLVTTTNERLDFGGLIAFKPGGKGTDLELKLSGTRLAQMLGGLVGKFVIPDQAYSLSGRLLLQEEGIALQNVEAEFSGNSLRTDGLIKLGNHFIGTGFELQIEGDNLSSLENFPAISRSIGVFVSGQTYQAKGRFEIENAGWRLSDIAGRVSAANFTIGGLVSPENNWMDSFIDFSLQGSVFDSLIKGFDTSDLPLGAFSSKGKFALADGYIGLKGFSFEAEKAHGKVDLQMGWPLRKAGDISFTVDVQGDDIRHFVPPFKGFEPSHVAYRIKTTGKRSGDVILLPQFEANIGNLLISLQGKVNPDLNDDNNDISFSVVSKDISVLGRFKGNSLPAEPVMLRADIRGSTSAYIVRNLEASLGTSQMEGSVDFSFKGVRPYIGLTINSNLIDIRPFLTLEEEIEEQDDKPGDGRLIPDIPMPMKQLALFDGDFQISIDEVRHVHDSLRDLELVATLRDDRLKVSKATAKGLRGRVSFSFFAEPAEAGKRDMEIDLSANDFLLNLTGAPGDVKDELPVFDVGFKGRAHGSNLRELAGSLNGSFRIGSEGGTLKGVDLSFLDASVLESAISFMAPKAAKTNIAEEIVCAASILKITDGLVETAPSSALTTDRLIMVYKGTVDLKTEEISFSFNATPTQAFKISMSELFQPYILVSGTLAEPKVGVDQGKMVLHGGATIGTFGAYAVVKGMADRAAHAASPCQKLLKQVQQGL